MAFKFGAGIILAGMMVMGGSGIDAADTLIDRIPVPVSSAQPADAPASVTLLSYNVEGLPWPIARGRGAAADAIAQQLLSLRQQGSQPQVVAVQEAFAGEAKKIGRAAGYAYTAYGPSEADEGAPATTAEDRSFAAKASLWIGERFGHHADSGLAVFSDYPIAWVKRVAFPTYACAGWDCFANKGVLVVALHVPGMDKPLIVVDTHLNSRTASKAPDERSLYAYKRQIDTLRTVLDGMTPDAGTVVMAGDYNVGRYPGRPAYMDERLFSGTDLKIAAVEQDCGRHCRKALDGLPDAKASLPGTKSMLVYRSAPGAAFQPAAPVSIFGRTAEGTMLSDHIGIAVRFAPATGGRAA